jgi:membrane-associated phospholipid phosphatase
MPFLQWLDHLDKDLFVLIQHGSSRFQDVIMVLLRNPYTWIPLYALMLFYAFRAGKKNAWVFIVLSVATFAITDSVTAQLLKPLFGRLRPCHNAEMQAVLHGLIDCGGLYSMPSNPAANHFGLAAFWYFSIYAMTGRKWRWLWLWAALICYAQVYVGKHYPFDVCVGAVFGTLIGYGMSRLFIYWIRRKSEIPPTP